MKAENIKLFLEEVERRYQSTKSTTEGSQTYVRMPEVAFPRGCTPATSEALIVLDVQQPAPQLLLKVIPHLANGAVPRSTSAVTAAGETWSTFSFNQPWLEDSDTALKFIEGRLRRFALNE